MRKNGSGEGKNEINKKGDRKCGTSVTIVEHSVSFLSFPKSVRQESMWDMECAFCICLQRKVEVL